MSKASVRRAARRAAREARQERRLASKETRQGNRQGFLTGIVGEGGLGALADKVLAGPDQPLPDTGGTGGKTEGEEPKDNTLLYVGLGLAAYMMMNKK